MIEPFECVVPEPDQIPPDDIIGVEDEEAIYISDESTELAVDEEAYRDKNHNLVGCKVKVFYPDEGGWFEGIISWYATSLGKLRVFLKKMGPMIISDLMK